VQSTDLAQAHVREIGQRRFKANGRDIGDCLAKIGSIDVNCLTRSIDKEQASFVRSFVAGKVLATELAGENQGAWDNGCRRISGKALGKTH